MGKKTSIILDDTHVAFLQSHPEFQLSGFIRKKLDDEIRLRERLEYMQITEVNIRTGCKIEFTFTEDAYISFRVPNNIHSGEVVERNGKPYVRIVENGYERLISFRFLANITKISEFSDQYD